MLSKAICLPLLFVVVWSVSQPARLLSRVPRLNNVPLRQRRSNQNVPQPHVVPPKPFMSVPSVWVLTNMHSKLPVDPIPPTEQEKSRLQATQLRKHNDYVLFQRNWPMLRGFVQTVSEISISTLNAWTITLDESDKTDGNFWICERCSTNSGPCASKKNYKLPAATSTIQIRFKDQLKKSTSWYHEDGTLWLELHPPPCNPDMSHIWFYSDRVIKSVDVEPDVVVSFE